MLDLFILFGVRENIACLLLAKYWKERRTGPRPNLLPSGSMWHIPTPHFSRSAKRLSGLGVTQTTVSMNLLQRKLSVCGVPRSMITVPCPRSRRSPIYTRKLAVFWTPPVLICPICMTKVKERDLILDPLNDLKFRWRLLFFYVKHEPILPCIPPYGLISCHNSCWFYATMLEKKERFLRRVYFSCYFYRLSPVTLFEQFRGIRFIYRQSGKILVVALSTYKNNKEYTKTRRSV